jgi:hypothetical protein
MKQRVATVHIFADTDNTDSSFSRRMDQDNFMVQINAGEKGFDFGDVKQVQTLLAHELGHVICMVTGDETHHPVNQWLYRMTNDAASLIPAERKAWQLAEKMVPEMDKKLLQDGLESYERNSSR